MGIDKYRPAGLSERPAESEPEKGIEQKPRFALDAWKYTPESIQDVMQILEAKSHGIRERLETALGEGGGKAFGLVVCDLLAERLRANDIDVTVPKWRAVSPLGQLSQRDLDLVYSSIGDNILRSSEAEPPEDWGSEESGKLKSYTSPDDFKKDYDSGVIPKTPFVLQSLVRDSFGMIVDIGRSELRDETIVRISSGNVRGWSHKNYTKPASDSEAAVAVFDSEGKSILPVHTYAPSFYENGAMPENKILPRIDTVLAELGITFGVQLEIFVDPETHAISLVQLRPSPGKLQEGASSGIHESLEGAEKPTRLMAETAIVSGVFDYTSNAEYVARESTSNEELISIGSKRVEYFKIASRINSREENLKKELAKENPNERYVANYEREIEMYRTQLVALEEEVGAVASTRSDVILFLDTEGQSSQALNLYEGAYISGKKVIVTSGPIIPTARHDYAGGELSGMSGAEGSKEVLTELSMISITDEELERLKKLLGEKPETKLRIVSDGMIGRVFVEK